MPGNSFINLIGYREQIQNILGANSPTDFPIFANDGVQLTVDVNPLANPTNSIVVTGSCNFTDNDNPGLGTSSGLSSSTTTCTALQSNFKITNVGIGVSGYNGVVAITWGSNGNIQAGTFEVNYNLTGSALDITVTQGGVTLGSGSYSTSATSLYLNTSQSFIGTLYSYSSQKPSGSGTGATGIEAVSASTNEFYTTSSDVGFYFTGLMLSTTGTTQDTINVQGIVNGNTVTLLQVNNNAQNTNTVANVAPTLLDKNTSVKVSSTTVGATCTLYGLPFNSNTTGLQAVNQ